MSIEMTTLGPAKVRFYDKKWREMIGVRAHEIVEEFHAQAYSTSLQELGFAVQVANTIKSHECKTVNVRLARQYGRANFMDMVEQMVRPVIPQPEPRNWYQEYANPGIPWLKPGEKPDPAGDLFLFEKSIRNPSPEQIARREAIAAHYRSEVEKLMEYFARHPNGLDLLRRMDFGVKPWLAPADRATLDEAGDSGQQ